MPLKSITEIPQEGIASKASVLDGRLKELGRVLVAFSGGVDSSLLLAAAAESCERVLAVTASSPIHPRREIEQARRIAQLIGCEHRILRSKELEDTSFTENPPDRCYTCKRALFGKLAELAREQALGAVVEGSNVDDLSDYRPGEKSLLELGIISPLRQADLGKAEIRTLAEWIGLPNAGQPASACLASRFPYGIRITADALGRVERLEDALIGMGFSQVRARYHEDLVRIEVEAGGIERFSGPAVRNGVIQAARREGFRYVTLDLQGYRRGSLNPA